jgi:predicted  nucleic acid-binding Zn-ribbon protein
MANNLLDLTNQLKSNIDSNRQTISSGNTQLIAKMKDMNQLAQAILEKVGNFTANSQTLQRNIETQAAQIADLTQQLETSKQEHSATQGQIQQIQTDLANAQGKGAESDALKQQLSQLQTEATASRQEIDSLTNQITQATQTIQQILGTMNSNEGNNQAELSSLVDALKKHIDDINEKMPGQPATPISSPLTTIAPSPVGIIPKNLRGMTHLGKMGALRQAFPLASEPVANPLDSLGLDEIPVEQRDPYPYELSILTKTNPSEDDLRRKAELLQDPELKDWRTRNPGAKLGGRFSKKYTMKRKKNRRTKRRTGKGKNKKTHKR